MQTYKGVNAFSDLVCSAHQKMLKSPVNNIMKIYTYIIVLLLTTIGHSKNFTIQPPTAIMVIPPPTISLRNVNETILAYNENIAIANANSYKIQQFRVFMLAFSPLLVHGIYRADKKIKNGGIANSWGALAESFAGFFFTMNGIKAKDQLWREDYERKRAIENCIRLYNSISAYQQVKIKDIKAYPQ